MYPSPKTFRLDEAFAAQKASSHQWLKPLLILSLTAGLKPRPFKTAPTYIRLRWQLQEAN